MEDHMMIRGADVGLQHCAIIRDPISADFQLYECGSPFLIPLLNDDDDDDNNNNKLYQ
jgi:hypothetical protein